MNNPNPLTAAANYTPVAREFQIMKLISWQTVASGIGKLWIFVGEIQYLKADLHNPVPAIETMFKVLGFFY
jgi:hypothetical protein